MSNKEKAELQLSTLCTQISLNNSSEIVKESTSKLKTMKIDCD